MDISAGEMLMTQDMEEMVAIPPLFKRHACPTPGATYEGGGAYHEGGPKTGYARIKE
jgi:hypothetical protein